MTKRTRVKLTWITFFVLIALAVFKHWLTGIDLAIIGIAVSNVLVYLWAETKRPSA